MKPALLRHAPGRSTRLWVALAAITTIIAAPLLAVAPAQADPTGYVGTDTDQAVWDDYGGNRTLPVMAEGVEYTGTLTGPQFGEGQTYKWSVIDGALPAGISLESPAPGIHSTSATFSGSPTATAHFSFTLRADTGENYFDLSFEGDVAPGTVGASPSWTDQTLVPFQVSVPVDDGVKADGDATITYSVSAGELPAGLTLSTATGAITGTPTTAGPYTFDLTATNEFGHVTATFPGTVATAPEIEEPKIDLALNFKAGTALSEASSAISADGLKVGSEYTLTMYSTPVVLYTGIIGPTGGFTWTVALPADTPVGAHRLVLSGIAPDGSTMTAEAWFTLLSNGTIGEISYTGPFTLANTGTEVVPTLTAGASFLAIGAILIALGARRRKMA